MYPIEMIQSNYYLSKV